MMRNKQKISLWLYRIVKFSLAAIFIYAGFTKLISPREFARLISAYEIVPEFFLIPLSVGLPLLEILCGIGLLFNIKGSLTTTTGLILLFMGVLWFGVLNDLDIGCGCFSANVENEHHQLHNALIRDFVFLAQASFLYAIQWLNYKKLKIHEIYTVSIFKLF